MCVHVLSCACVRLWLYNIVTHSCAWKRPGRVWACAAKEKRCRRIVDIILTFELYCTLSLHLVFSVKVCGLMQRLKYDLDIGGFTGF